MIGYSQASPAPADREPPHPEASPRTALLLELGDLTRRFVAGLEARGIHTYAAEGMGEVLELMEGLEPEVVVLGIPGKGGSPDRDGVPALIRRIRAVAPSTALLVLLDSTDSDVGLQMLRAGADDVVSPPHTVDAALLRADLCRGRAGDGARLRRSGRSAALRIERLSRTLTRAGSRRPLTNREFELLERLLHARGSVVPRDELLKDIWGSHQNSEAVLDATVHRLRKKLERDPQSPVLLTTVRGIGYRLEPECVEIADG